MISRLRTRTGKKIRPERVTEPTGQIESLPQLATKKHIIRLRQYAMPVVHHIKRCKIAAAGISRQRYFVIDALAIRFRRRGSRDTAHQYDRYKQ